MIIDRSETKAFVRVHGRSLRCKLSRLYASALEPKVARTYADDIDVCHGMFSVRCEQSRSRPGQRDDERQCAYRMLLAA